MQIRHKILLGYLAIVAVSVVLVVGFLVTLWNISQHYSDLLNRDQQALMHANYLRSGVSRQIMAARSFELIGDTTLIVEFDAAFEAQERALTRISPLLSESDDQLALGEIVKAAERYRKVAREMMDLADQGMEDEVARLRTAEGEPARRALVDLCDAFIERLNQEVAASKEAVTAQVDQATTRLLLGAIIGLATALVAATLITEGLTSPLRKLMNSIQGISSGDFETPITVKSKDELGELAAVVDTMRRRLAVAAEQNEALFASAREEAQKLAQVRGELEETNAELEAALVTESEARQRIEEINRLRTEFASMVSHELKTPVSYVYNYAAALKGHNESLNEGQRREFLTAIQSEAQHLLTLIDDILAVSLLEQGGLKHRFVETDLRKLTDSVVKDQQITTRRHTLTVKGPDALPVNADPNRLKQVLNNLLSNAIKYSPQGGPVEVRLRANPADSTAIIYVRDHGIGIRPGDVPRLFDRFTRIQRRETIAIPGTGLGLYIAHHIVEAHGGRLSLEPAPGKGTIAQVSVPMWDGAGGEGTKNATQPLGDGHLQDGVELESAVIIMAAGAEPAVAEAAATVERERE
jgi:signal transduction histidine kinase/CHASE3 domain sensor protein